VRGENKQCQDTPAGSKDGLELLPFFGVLALSRFGKRLQIFDFAA